PGGVEGLWHHRHQEFYVVQFAPDPRCLVAGERVALDLDDLVALDDAVAFEAVDLVSQPAHRFPPFRRVSPDYNRAERSGNGGSPCLNSARNLAATASPSITRSTARRRPTGRRCCCRTATARPAGCGTARS